MGRMGGLAALMVAWVCAALCRRAGNLSLFVRCGCGFRSAAQADSGRGSLGFRFFRALGGHGKGFQSSGSEERIRNGRPIGIALRPKAGPEPSRGGRLVSLGLHKSKIEL